ncbi:M56 family metallopeptidase [Mucilaginibacter myungsuensis]|uniref:TonB family protein n=1 Tax=Mucilaginibacter myungsuensis TaxID=649104 RepID=A0A929KXR5_9SPHI|nr:M56 family metallopeptidase [Mucilaginibacter myungsuensis]MBE9662455.1 TonB family protein [Mucilaginibacter myungsuensis]MDN3597875.1 TonB family protein [Mucilaginibacter myungsuensis]
MSWIKYLLEANLYLALFFAAYYLLMRKDTHYQLSRAYLLGTTLLAFAIPFLELGMLKPAVEIIEPAITTASDLTTGMPAYPIIIRDDLANAQPVEPINYYLWIYIAVGTVMAFGLIFRIMQLVRLARKGRTEKMGDIDLIRLDEDDHAFSFFNYLFISRGLASSDTIIRHEMVHIRQKHSYDIMYIEVLKIVCWFNPAVYFIHHSIKQLHEYIVDRAIAAEKDDVDRYTDFLIRNAYGLPAIAPANNFFTKNLLKDRIMMLHQKRSGSLATLKYLVAVPLTTGMLCLSTLGFSKDHYVLDIAPKALLKSKPAFAMTTNISERDIELKQLDPDLRSVTDTLPKAKSKPSQKTTTKKVDDQLKNILGPTSPLYVIDNVTITKENAATYGIKTFGNGASPLSFIPQENIASMEILKDGTAMSLYGERGKHGVILITTVKGKAKDETEAQEQVNSQYRSLGLDVSKFLTPTSPIYVVDGVRLTKENSSSYGYNVIGNNESPLSVIKQEDIASMEILKDAAAISMYGDAGRYGVILITTLKGQSKKAMATAAAMDSLQKMLPKLYKFIEMTTKYPSVARERGHQGKVFIVFNVNDDNKITNYKLLRGITDEIDQEVIRALKAWNAPAGFPKDLNFTLPISFNLAVQNDSGNDIQPVVLPTTSTLTPEPYTPNNFKSYSLSETVIRGYVRKSK